MDNNTHNATKGCAQNLATAENVAEGDFASNEATGAGLIGIRKQSLGGYEPLEDVN